MTVLPFLIVAATAGIGSLLARGHRPWSTTIAAAGLAAMVVLAVRISPASTVQIGGTTVAASDWLRLFALLGSAIGLLLVIVDAATVHEPDVPGSVVVGLGAAVLAIALPDPVIAVLAATAGGLAGILVAAPVGAAARAAFVGVRELRAIVIAGALAIVATSWLARPLGDLVAAPAVFGLAYAAFAVAVAVRFGAIPFHLWAARVADAAPGAALPLLLAWAPAAFAAIALAWIDRSVAPLALDLGGEQTLVALIGAVTIVLGYVAAWVQDDLEHVVGYTIAADAGFVVLGLAAFEPAVWEPSRTWLLVFVVGRSAFAGWAVALHGGFGTRRLPELAGWARRRPVLGVALAAIAVAAVGLPGIAAWDARTRLAALSLPAGLDLLISVAPVVAIAIYGRILWIGARPEGPVVRAGASDRPGWPTALPHRPMVGRGSMERVFERLGHGLGAGLDILWAGPAAARRNRAPIASIAVLALAGLALAVSGGGLGVPAAARAAQVVGDQGPDATPRPTPSEPSPSTGPDEPAFTFEPVGDGSAAPSVDTSPAPSVGGSAAPSG